MAVQSDSFSSVILTDEDAEQFKQELQAAKPSAAATEAAIRGRQLLAQMREAKPCPDVYEGE